MPQRGPGRLGVIERMLGLRGFNNMRLPQKLLLWGQTDMLQVPQLLLGVRVGPCKKHFYEHKPVVGSAAVLWGEGDEQPVSKEGWRCLLCELQAGQVSLPSAAAKRSLRGSWDGPSDGDRQEETTGGKKEIFSFILQSKNMWFPLMAWTLHKRLQMPGFVHKGRIPLY